MPGKLLGKSLIVSLTWLVLGCEILPEAPCEIDCEGDEKLLLESGAERLGPDEVRAHVSGKTEQWVYGGAFYHDSGRLEIKWHKVNYKSAWEVGADGTLCYQLETWGRRYHFYMEKDGEFYMLDEGKNIGVRAMYDGNRLRQIKGYSPAPESDSRMFRFKSKPVSE